MTTSPDLGIVLLEAQQQQPNVSHNEALLQISALLNGVINMTTNAPPGSPVVGDAYAIAAAPTGVWTGRPRSIAFYTTGGWRFAPGDDSSGTPIVMGLRQHGMRIYNRFDDTLYGWDGTAWVAL